MTKFDLLRVPCMNRRHFLHGASAGLFVLGTYRNLAWSQSETQSALSGTEFNLEIGEMPVDFTGRARIGTVVNGQVPAPLLRWREGDTVTVRVSNRLATRSSIPLHVSRRKSCDQLAAARRLRSYFNALGSTRVCSTEHDC